MLPDVDVDAAGLPRPAPGARRLRLGAAGLPEPLRGAGRAARLRLRLQGRRQLVVQHRLRGPARRRGVRDPAALAHRGRGVHRRGRAAGRDGVVQRERAGRRRLRDRRAPAHDRRVHRRRRRDLQRPGVPHDPEQRRGPRGVRPRAVRARVARLVGRRRLRRAHRRRTPPSSRRTPPNPTGEPAAGSAFEPPSCRALLGRTASRSRSWPRQARPPVGGAQPAEKDTLCQPVAPSGTTSVRAAVWV